MNTLAREITATGWERIFPESINTGAHLIGVRLEQLLGLLTRFHAVAAQRRALSRLTDDQLKDIGLSRVDALREASKPFWK